MTDDIRKQIEAAAREYSLDSVDSCHRVDFTAGAEFGYGLAEMDFERMKEAELDTAYALNVARKERDHLTQRVKELEADRSMVTTQLIELRTAADEMARALESADKTLKYAQEEYAHGHGVNLIYETIQTNGRALDRYRKLVGKERLGVETLTSDAAINEEG